MKIITLLFALFSMGLYAQDVYWVHLKADNIEQRNQIANLIHIDQYIDGKIYSVVNEFDYKKLNEELKELIIESHKMDQISNNRIETSKDPIYEFPKGEEKFHTYKEANDLLDSLSQKYPDLAETFSIGRTHENREIKGIRITKAENRNSKNFVPGILFAGTHHAREHLSTEVPLFLAKYLVENYQTNQEIKDLVDSRDIYFIPIVNPDGTLHDIVNRNYKMWRKNRRLIKKNTYGVDLNRNYGYEWNTGGSSSNPRSDVYHGEAPFSEPETQAIKDFVDSKPNIRIMLSFHTYSELILYPWGSKNDPVGGREEEVFKKMATTMSKWNNYKPMSSSDLYIASGDTCDWAFGEHGIFCFTFELSPANYSDGGFYPGQSFIDKVNNANLNPAIYLIRHSGNPYEVID